MPNEDKVPRHKRSIGNRRNETFSNHSLYGNIYFNKSSPQVLNRIKNGDEVNNNKYPWQVLVFNKLTDTWDGHGNHELNNEDPDGTNFDICSGSIISNKHILTSAECLLKNKKNNLIEYSDKGRIIVKLGDDNRKIIDNRRDGEYVPVMKVMPHENAFTEGYNYNIGR